MAIIEQYIVPGLKLLPEKMDTVKARAQLVAIGFQESGFTSRKQVGGPARGLWQFEKGGGIVGVLNHPSTCKIIQGVCERIVLPPYADLCYGAVAYHDALACCFARLLLWTSPMSLPDRDEMDKGWLLYLTTWRPGKPRPEDWPENFKRAWEMVT